MSVAFVFREDSIREVHRDGRPVLELPNRSPGQRRPAFFLLAGITNTDSVALLPRAPHWSTGKKSAAVSACRVLHRI